ncbi:MAG: hypothetical protein HMLKMBBP_03305 [Planctomycetes bacterium]|nr:hypothetical protein [Planctomycetota bacterium]
MRTRFPALRIAACASSVLLASAAAFAVDPDVKKMAKDADSFKRSDAARALAKDGSAEAAAILAGLFEDKDPYVRDLSASFCESLKSKEAIDAVAAAAKSKDEIVRSNVAVALGRTKSPDALPHLERLARKDPSARVRIDAFDALWEFKKDPAALAICAAGAADAEPEVRAAAIEAAGRVGGDPAGDVVRGALADKDEGVRAVARMELRFVARDEALATITEAAKDPSWRVRAQVVDDASWMKEAPAIDALVALVADPVLRVSSAAHRHLRDLTGKELGRDAEIWKAWWAQNRESWTAPRGKGDAAAGDDAGKTTSGYHGLDLGTDRAAFVIDFSGSMRDRISASDARVRWDVAKDELSKTVASLPDGFVVQVVLFSLKPAAALQKASPATKKVRDDVLSFLGRETPSHRGNLLDGMLAAIRDDALDTVFLLSDGAPSAGDHVVKERVRNEIRQANRTRKLAIHCIGFGATKQSERSFLEDVARDGGGRCVFR